MNHKTITHMSAIFKTLADESRLRILAAIQERQYLCCCGKCIPQKDVCLRDLSKALGVTMATISHHINELVKAGLITTRKEGKCVFCRINNETFERTGQILSTFQFHPGEQV